MNPDIIAIGYKPHVHIHVICNNEGLKQIPPPLEFYTDGGGDLHNGAIIALTKANLVALRMMGVVSDRDIIPMMKCLQPSKLGDEVAVPTELVNEADSDDEYDNAPTL